MKTFRVAVLSGVAGVLALGTGYMAFADAPAGPVSPIYGVGPSVTPPRVAGATGASSTTSLPTRRSIKPATPATRRGSRIGITCLPVTRSEHGFGDPPDVTSEVGDATLL